FRKRMDNTGYEIGTPVLETSAVVHWKLAKGERQASEESTAIILAVRVDGVHESNHLVVISRGEVPTDIWLATPPGGRLGAWRVFPPKLRISSPARIERDALRSNTAPRMVREGVLPGTPSGIGQSQSASNSPTSTPLVVV